MLHVFSAFISTIISTSMLIECLVFAVALAGAGRSRGALGVWGLMNGRVRISKGEPMANQRGYWADGPMGPVYELVEAGTRHTHTHTRTSTQLAAKRDASKQPLKFLGTLKRTLVDSLVWFVVHGRPTKSTQQHRPK